MSSVRQLLLMVALFGLALVVSGLLYIGSQSADFDRHARAVEALGSVRHLNEHLSQQVLAARFGLLNQYDSITSTELDLTDSARELDARITEAVAVESPLRQALANLEESIARERGAVERFKTENSVLKNSVYYLPTAAREAGTDFADPAERGSPQVERTSLAIHRLTQAALVYNLVGDESARQRHHDALAELQACRDSAPDALRQRLESLLSHARVIELVQPSVDQRVKQVVDSNVGAKLAAVERGYHQRFGQAVSASNRYRKILYGWSLLLVLAVGLAGLQLKRLYADLERRVSERTADLRRALSALWGEMRLARKIQEALVPASPTLAGCEVAASMRATDEVGGDYYDVIRVGKYEWILIGDVSGHGVPAGLVMMMCHTAVRTVLCNDPEVAPARLLALVNSVLTENIRQLGEDKYMTISALRREPDGTVSFAGAHQDILIYRAGAACVETVETSGVWLGIRNDIAHALETGRFRLDVGDVLVLYTDGITEATRDGMLFDTQNVRRMLERAGDKPAQQVLNELFAELEGYRLTDDATAIVVRQLAEPADPLRKVGHADVNSMSSLSY